jgi:hypothetical protein
MARVVPPTVALLVAVLAASAAALPATASAQHGNGLYEPFPRAAVLERAKRFVERFRVPGTARRLHFSEQQLARGAFVAPAVAGLPKGSGLGPTGPGAASARAGVRGGGGSWLAAGAQVALVLLAIVMLAVLGGRRSRRRVAAV